MTDQWYVLPVNPEPWAIGPVGYARRAGRMTAYVGRNTQLDTYKKTIQEAIESESPVMLEGKLSVTFFFWRHRAEYKTPQAHTHRKHEADVTNLQKSTEDALQSVLYKNDKDNIHVDSYIMAQGPDVIGKVVIRISEAEVLDPSVFPDEVLKKIEEIDNPVTSINTPNSYQEGEDDFF